MNLNILSIWQFVKSSLDDEPKTRNEERNMDDRPKENPLINTHTGVI